VLGIFAIFLASEKQSKREKWIKGVFSFVKSFGFLVNCFVHCIA
jgi:hypothetical protein